ncbi:MAG TPA: NusG domain II-containing protein [Patescibacteria group bacterium]|nr:NusG domain II-containing protein [Patescibacteria group bacterium]
MIKRNDIILIISILLISILGIFAIRMMDKEYNIKTAVITIDGSEVSRVSIADTAEEKTISFKFGDHLGYLEVKDGAVRVIEMDKKVCPEGICSDTGWISKSYETIVCLPNRIAVYIENGEAANEDSNLVDSVSS